MFGIFNSDGEDKGCNSHHWREFQPQTRHRTFTRDFNSSVSVERRYVATCMHSGCFEKREEWRRVGELDVITGEYRTIGDTK